MPARKSMQMVAAGALIATSLPAFANHDRWDRDHRGRHARVVVEHRQPARVVQRPVRAERRVVVERPVYVDRPVYVERPAPVYDPGYGYEPGYSQTVYEPAEYGRPVYEPVPVAYPSYPAPHEPNVLGAGIGAVIGAVIGGMIGSQF